MDRPPFGLCLTLYAGAASGWRDLTAGLAVDHGVDPWSWSARLLLDVVSLLVRRHAAADDDPLAATRAARVVGDDDAWGRISADEAAAIVAGDNSGVRRDRG